MKKDRLTSTRTRLDWLMRQIHDSGCDMNTAKSGHLCQLCHYRKLHQGSHLKDNNWASARPLTADGLVYKRHLSNESLTVMPLNCLEISPSNGGGGLLPAVIAGRTTWPWSDRWVATCTTFPEGDARDSPVLQRVLGVFGGDLARHRVPKRRGPVIVAVGERGEKAEKMSPSALKNVMADPHTNTLLYRSKPNVRVTISGPAERESARRPSRAKSTRRIIS